MTTHYLRATHIGPLHFGADLTCDAVVLENGERGYVRRQVARLLGLDDRHKGGRFARFWAEFAPNHMKDMEIKGGPILLPSGQKGHFFPAGLITEAAIAVVDAACQGKLHKARAKMVPRCLTMVRALATVGETALIDEATGFQYQRAPDALQDLVARLLRQSCSQWERRFQPDYYQALYRLFGWTYHGHVQNPPHIIGRITFDWVYAPVLPMELLNELRLRKRWADKHHQWLSQQGLQMLERQIHAVTAIALGSVHYKDFVRRCRAAFGDRTLQLALLDDDTPHLS